MDETMTDPNDAFVENLAPDADVLIINLNGWKIDIARLNNGKIQICVSDLEEGGETSYILGEEGFSEKL